MTDASQDPKTHTGSSQLVASQLLSDLAGLFRAEGTLLRAEFDDRITQLQAAIAKIAVGIIVCIVGFSVLANAVVIAVAEIFSDVDATHDAIGWASLVVGVLLGLIGVVALKTGIEDLQPSVIVPARTGAPVPQRKTAA